MPAYQPRYAHDVVYFNGDAVNHTSWALRGTGVRIDAIEGWEGSYEIRDVREPNTSRDGEHADSVYAAGRSITISGYVHGSSWEDLQSRKRSLAAIFAHSTTDGVLKVPDPNSSVQSSLYEFAQALTPVAYWRLGEAVGSNTADNATGTSAYDGTYSGPTLGTTGSVAGDEDTCADFDGTDDYVSIAYASALNPAAITVAAWVYVDGGSGAIRTIYDSRNSGQTTGFALRITAANVAAFGVAEAGGYSEGSGTTTIATGAWYHIAGVYSGGNRSLYVNGVLESGPTADTYTANTTTETRIGRSTASDTPFNGKIDEVMLFSSALSASNILQLYRRASGEAANNDTDGFERSSCRVIEPIVFGGREAYGVESFTVALRASDPRIYDDLAITETGAGVTFTNAGRVTTPASIAITPIAAGGTNPVEKLALNGTSQISFIRSRLTTNDSVTVRTPDRTADWTSPYYNGRLKLFDPVAYWRLNEAAGVTADNAEGTAAYDGTYTNTPTLNQTGHSSSIISVNFNGTDEYVTVPYASALNPKTMSVELWVSFDVTAGEDAIMGSYRTSGGNFYGHRLYRTGTSIGLEWWNGSTTTSSPLISDNNGNGYTTATWYHIVYVMGAAGVSVYVNGELDVGMSYATAGLVFEPVPSTSALEFGRATNPSGTSYLDGNIDNVMLLNRALTSSEVAALYSARTVTPTFTNYGGYVIEPAATSWFLLPVGTCAIATSDGVSSLSVTYREARL